ncbi:MAG TPA: hypothetical protein VGI56_02075 [Galbitalea sp.]
MSDDTPTERFDPVDKPQPTPTVPMPAAGAEPPASQTAPTVAAGQASSWTSGPSRPRKKPGSRGPLIAFVILAILVGAAIVVLIVLLAENGSSSTVPTPSNTTSTSNSPAPSNTPSATPTPDPTTPPAAAGSFVAVTPRLQQAGCDFHGGKDQGSGPPVQVSWATQNAVSVWVAAGNSDAADAGGMQIPLSGDQRDFPNPLVYNCQQSSNTFTMTLVDANGTHISETWVVTVRAHHR